MRKQDIVHHFGSIGAVAAALGITSQAVTMWPDKVPLLRQYQLERITNGALKADNSHVSDPAAETQRA